MTSWPGGEEKPSSELYRAPISLWRSRLAEPAIVWGGVAALAWMLLDEFTVGRVRLPLVAVAGIFGFTAALAFLWYTRRGD